MEINFLGEMGQTFDFISSVYVKIKDVVPFVDKILIVLVALGFFMFIFQNIQTAFKYISKIRNNFQTKIYRVTIPKALKEEDPDKRKDVKSVLAGFELFFYNMAGVEAEKGKGIIGKIKYLFKERSDHFSIETITDKEGLISFYICVSTRLDVLLRQQITGVWPDAFIEEMADYNIFDPGSESLAAEIFLSKNFAFPIKTYPQFETDPLDLLLNAMSKFSKDDGIVIQILARSAKSDWRSFGNKIAKLVNEGRSVDKAMREAKTSPVLKELTAMFYAASGKENTTKFEAKKLSPAEEEVVKAIENKLNKPGMDVNIRVIVSGNEKDKEALKRKLQNILDSFYQYGHYGLLNSFKSKIPKSKSAQNALIKDIVYRNFKEVGSYVLSSEELTTLFHLPLSTADIPNIRWLLARTAPATFRCNKEGVVLGNNTYRGVKNEIRISLEDRMRHMYILGKSGTGKTNMMKDMAVQDALAGRGFCIIDPHGDFAENVLSYIPKERAEDVIYFDPSDLERPLGLNLYEFDAAHPEQKTLVVNQFIEMLYTMYDKEQIGGPMFEYYTKNALLLNMEDVDSGNTMIEIPKVMAQDDFRHMKLDKCKDPIIKDFWTKEAEKAGGDAALANIVPYITSKLNQFIVNEFMRNIIGQQKSTINFADIMNTKKILICNFSKGKIGDMNSQLLGLIVTGRILIAALQRANLPEKDRHPFFLYIDECQNFLTPTITTILAEARKYGLGLVLANQFITQLVKGNDTTIKDGIFGNAGTLCAYRISTEDAEFMEKIMSPVFSRFDLENSPTITACAKTLINNSATEPFTLVARKYWEVYGQPTSPELQEKANYFKELSRLKYGRPRDMVNKEIMDRLGFGEKANDKENIEDELKRLFGD